MPNTPEDGAQQSETPFVPAIDFNQIVKNIGLKTNLTKELQQDPFDEEKVLAMVERATIPEGTLVPTIKIQNPNGSITIVQYFPGTNMYRTTNRKPEPFQEVEPLIYPSVPTPEEIEVLHRVLNNDPRLPARS